ncbi:MAG: hypothetical protein HXX08_15620 [Chloroflexi bacterium]|uniref:Molybdopterin molybdenumtransferase n=1 Tax=Candidatus Chlorohelix allophototropha TaxID=3003348 RepID=A0A8T7M5A9_9CHLR|nr:hypothetical protein [Chloroflexota bacterium]WJW69209.1 hypothetical protein OZ401_002805 [Chloroflexota bacterium L227-S17]
MEVITLPLARINAVPIELVLPELQNKVVAANVPDFGKGSGYLFRKGQILSDNVETRAAIKSLGTNAPQGFELHLIVPGAGDVGEDAAGLALAQMVAGSGVELSGPSESRYNLLATARGLLSIDLERLERLNELPGVAVFTLYNHMAIEAGREVAGAKVTTLVYPEEHLRTASLICEGAPIIDVKPFLPRKIGVIYREVLKESVRKRFVDSVRNKLNWFGAENLGVQQVQSLQSELVERLRAFKQQGAELVLHVGGHSSDPLDPIFGALQEVGARMERQGAPAHPGTLFWLAYWDEMAIFGLASCGMFSETTLGDLFLARFCAGERLTNRDIARMGHGGLFIREMAFRFPDYGRK